MSRTFDLRAESLSAQAAWSRRVRRIGGFIQAAFAGFWLIRGSLVLPGLAITVVPVVAVVSVVAAFGYGFWATAGIAPRPAGVEARRLERDISIATVLQLLASFVAPAIVIAAGHSDWTLPSIAITIGPLLLWLNQQVIVPLYRPVGWALIVTPALLVATLSGTPLIAITGLGAGAVLLVTALVGFHDLAVTRKLTAPHAVVRRSKEPVRPASAAS
ncbi:MAG: hypothetical protein QOJ11_2983 [Frankiales bacterium]|nr:hypothetical protein [Frankiales bacterium]